MNPFANHNIDQFIMLLSTDWFFPYWSVIGITVDDLERKTIQEGCRTITNQIVSAPPTNSQSLYLERRNQVESAFRDLLSDSESANRAFAERAETSHEDLTAAWFFMCMDIELTRRSSIEGHELDSEIRSIVIRLHKRHFRREIDFSQLCSEADSSWDRESKDLTPETPTALADSLQSFIWLRQFKAFWNEICKTLSTVQKSQLVDWYQRVAKSRTGREIQPTFF